MNRKWITRAAAALVFIAIVTVSYLYLPERYAANPLTSLVILAVLIACIPLIRLRFRKHAGNDRFLLGPQFAWKWRPPLWIGFALMFGAFIWLFGALLLGDGTSLSAHFAFIPFGIMVFLGCALLAARFAAWLLDLIQNGNA